MLLDLQCTMVEALLHVVQHSLHFSAFVDDSGGMVTLYFEKFERNTEKRDWSVVPCQQACLVVVEL